MNTTPLHISRLDLSAFRGIERTLGLDLGRRLTIIYGGNATGKSSIAQSIEFAISGQVRDHEDGLIPAGYLANTRAGERGQVSLTLDGGGALTGVTDRPRGEIERRFREIAGVDWPDRQPLPITTTHVTTQGMLARVLGNTNAVTRNDLSGLCAGAYLRFLVARSSKLAIHFRQASSGLNVQAELREALATYDTAKLLLDSLLGTSRHVTDVSATAIDLKLHELNATLGLPIPASLDVAIAQIETRFASIDEQHRILQSLLNRTRELGQYEAESDELQKQLADAKATERDLLERRATHNASLLAIGERLKGSTSTRARLMDAMAAHERYQQASSGMAALNDRLRDIRSSQERTEADIQAYKQDLDSARNDLAARSARLAQSRQSRHTADVQRSALEQAIAGVALLPTNQDPTIEAAIDVLRLELASLEPELEIAERALDTSRRDEALIAAQLSEISKVGERFLAVSNEMRTFATGSDCPLCGHDHGSSEAVMRSIDRVAATVLEGADSLRSRFEAAAKARREAESRQLELTERIAQIRGKTLSLLQAMEEKRRARTTQASQIEENLRRVGLALPLETELLKRAQADLEATIAGADQEISDTTTVEREDEARRSQLERALAAKQSEAEQLARLTSDLANQIEKIKATLSAGLTDEDLATNKAQIVEVEPLIRALEREQGQTHAGLLELDRAAAEKRAEISGIERRLQVVDGFLDSLDAELQGVGATRDARTILDIEQRTRQQRDAMVALRSAASTIRQEMRILEEGRAQLKAREQLRAAEDALKALQGHQQRLHARGLQFKALNSSLEGLQNDTAEIVLANIRKPVSILFQAMTAGCPWDIEFRLEDGKVNAVLTDGSTRDVAATSVLNSAYVNVAAIALRLALASQQRWTRLRTVVLDDPILEMDHLTQSALIDGLEAVLSSAFAPWGDLQFVLTTWSEDFAVMAAHKLAHLNSNNSPTVESGSFVDEFLIHHLSTDIDGTITSQRYVPRWRKEASAA